MAEIFGAVASAVGVAGVAAQFTDGIRKLAQFCRDVRDAPEDVRYAANELELLTNILKSMEIALRTHSFPGEPDFSSVISFCTSGKDQVGDLLVELEADIKRRRKLGRVRTAWKKPEIDRYMSRIERAKTSILMVQSVYHGALSQYNAALIFDKISAIRTDLMDGRQARIAFTDTSCQITNSSNVRPVVLDISTTANRNQMLPAKNDRRKRGQLHHRFISLRAHCVMTRSQTRKFISLLGHLDIPGIRDMFDVREISAFPGSWQWLEFLLGFSKQFASHGRFDELCQLLIYLQSHGAACSWTVESLRGLVSGLSGGIVNSHLLSVSDEQLIRLYRIVIRDGFLDEDDIFSLDQKIALIAPKTLLEYIHKPAWSPLEDEPKRHGFQVMNIFDFGSCNPTLISRFLQPNPDY